MALHLRFVAQSPVRRGGHGARAARYMLLFAIAVALLACSVVHAAEPAPAPKVNTGSDECAGATVLATYSPTLQFGLDGQHFSSAMFAAEVVRRNEGKPLRCVIVTASCRDAALSKQTYLSLKPYGVTRVSWQPDRALFPKPTDKMPECKQ